MDLSLVIPIYNETRRFSRGLKLALNYLKRQSYSWEIIVVDDGSSDSTPHLLNKFKSQIHFFRTVKNFGKGHAIRVGVAASRGDYVIFSDIDFSVSIDHLPEFLAALKSFDIAIASRRLPQSRIAQRQDYWRESLGRGFTGLSNLILGLNHTDFTCGLKGFKAAAAKDLFSRQRLNRWAFDPEILFLARKLHYQVKELPVTWHNHPLTKVHLLTDLPQSLISLFLIRPIHP